MIAFPHRRAAPIRYERLPGAVIAAWRGAWKKPSRRRGGAMRSETEHYRVGYFPFFSLDLYDHRPRRRNVEKVEEMLTVFGLCMYAVEETILDEY